jgi:hypothetical protein
VLTTSSTLADVGDGVGAIGAQGNLISGNDLSEDKNDGITIIIVVVVVVVVITGVAIFVVIFLRNKKRKTNTARKLAISHKPRSMDLSNVAVELNDQADHHRSSRSKTYLTSSLDNNPNVGLECVDIGLGDHEQGRLSIASQRGIANSHDCDTTKTI